MAKSPPAGAAIAALPSQTTAYTTDLVPVVRGGLVVLVPIATLSSPSTPPTSNPVAALLLMKVL